MKLSIIAPCYNEEINIKLFYDEVLKNIEKIKNIKKYEIIYIDDGSNDNTLIEIKKIAEKNKSVKYISFSRNFGKESAIFAGLEYSNGDYIVLMDVDLQHPPELMELMVKKISEDNYDSVAAIRKDRNKENFIRAFFSKSFYLVLNKISNIEIKKNSTDYRMMTKQFKESVLSLGEYNRFTKGIFNWVGYETYNIEYENISRKKGESKWSFMDLFKYSIEGIISFSVFPLLISSILGIISFTISIIMLVVFFFKSIIFGEVIRGFPTIICSIFFIGGIQLLSIGILGQYLAKTYLEVKNRPQYIIKDKSE